MFHQAIENQGSDRARFLDEACGGNGELRCEVESLISAMESCENFLSRPAIEAAAQELASSIENAPIGGDLGHFRIISLLGVGGMGEVYRARDLELGRDVAIKTLPEGFRESPERLARFEREAKLLASLNHPGIATLFDFQDCRGTYFLVMELVEGQTLADRVRRSPLSLEEVLVLGGGIATAVAAAHEKRIVHRDLKPANIKIQSDGTLKILDFGLAKALPNDPDDRATAADFISNPSSKLVLGTPTYMSPEQAGRIPVDERTDIWSFGCLLFEMLCGEALFRQSTISDRLDAIANREPDWERLPVDTPPSLVRLLRACLQKDRERRPRSIATVGLVLGELAPGRRGTGR